MLNIKKFLIMENKNKYNNSGLSRSAGKSKIDKNKNSRFGKPGFGSQQSRHGVLSLTQLLSRAGKKRSNGRGRYSIGLLGSPVNEKVGVETKKLSLNSSTNSSSSPSSEVKGKNSNMVGNNFTNGSELTDKQGSRNFTLRNNGSGLASTQSKQTVGKSLVNGFSSSAYDRKKSDYPFGAANATGGKRLPNAALGRDFQRGARGAGAQGLARGSASRFPNTPKGSGANRTTSNVTKEGSRFDRTEQSGQTPLKPIIPPKSLIIILKEKPEKILYNRRIIDYKHCGLLQRYIGLGGKILPRRQTRLTAVQQRYIAKTIKTARIMGLLPFVSKEKSYFK